MPRTQIRFNPDDFNQPPNYRSNQDYTPYHQWKDRAILETAFIINNACNDDWIMVEYDRRADANYQSRIARCRWYISCNLQDNNLMVLKERIPETDEMIWETLEGIITDWSHPNIFYKNTELLDNTMVHQADMMNWQINADVDFRVKNERYRYIEEAIFKPFYDLPSSKITNCTPEGEALIEDLVIFEEKLRETLMPFDTNELLGQEI
jgi:hypothetical protein